MIRPALLLVVPLLTGCSRHPVECIDADPEGLARVLGALLAEAEGPLFTAPQRTPKEEAIAGSLEGLRWAGWKDHLRFLVEYGLRIHVRNLEQTRLARRLPVTRDPALSELVRLAKIPPFRTAHEAGWLSSQFYEPPHQGWSSYQVYLWAKERHVFDDWPNEGRIQALLKLIDASPAAKVGGDNVCHYGCQ